MSSNTPQNTSGQAPSTKEVSESAQAEKTPPLPRPQDTSSGSSAQLMAAKVKVESYDRNTPVKENSESMIDIEANGTHRTTAKQEEKYGVLKTLSNSVTKSTLAEVLHKTNEDLKVSKARAKYKSKLLKIFKASYPEYTRSERIIYPLDDKLLREMPELHDIIILPKPKPDPSIILEEHFADLLEIWNFCYRFKHFLGISAFSVEELHDSIEGPDPDQGFLFAFLIQCLIQAYIKDIKEFPEKEIYSTPAILVLELVDDLPNFPLEAISLIFTIKRYRKCIALCTLDLLKKCVEKSATTTNAIHALSYKEKKELLLNLCRGLSVCAKIRETVNKSVQDQKDRKRLEKQKAGLQKELDHFDTLQKGPNSAEITPEKRKEMNSKTREMSKMSSEIKKRKVRQTTLLGSDAEETEYWIFSGDKSRIYMRSITENNKERWSTYSTLQQVNELIQVLIEKGTAEKKLKSEIQAALPNLSLFDPLSDPPLNNKERKDQSYQERIRPNKRKPLTLPQPTTVTLPKVQGEMLTMEENFWQFFAPRNLLWNHSPARLAWRERGIWCESVKEVKKWALIFITRTMTPFITGEVSKPIRNLIKSATEYEFELNGVSDEDEEERAPAMEEAKTISLKGVIWWQLGKDAFTKWHKYYCGQVETVNELTLAIKMYKKLLEYAYEYVREVEEEQEKKKPKSQPRAQRRQQWEPKVKRRENRKVAMKQEKVQQTTPSIKKEWNEECYVCGDGGELVRCESCPNAAHLSCVNLTKTPTESWQCESCLLKAIVTRQTRSQTKRTQDFVPPPPARTRRIDDDFDESYQESDHESDSDY